MNNVGVLVVVVVLVTYLVISYVVILVQSALDILIRYASSDTVTLTPVVTTVNDKFSANPPEVKTASEVSTTLLTNLS